MTKKRDIKIITNNDLNDDLNKLNEVIYSKFKCKITIDTENKLCICKGSSFELIILCISLILAINNVDAKLSDENKKVILSLIIKVVDGLK